jgi:glycine dehydrogenase subunit 1
MGAHDKLLFGQSPRFHEFVLQTEEPPKRLNARLMEKKIIGGLDLCKWYPELGSATLWCATELTTKEQIDAAVAIVAEISVASAAR